MTSPILRRVAIVTIIVAAMVAVTLLDLPLCPTATFLHFPCPGCGMTRATLAALHGDFAASFYFHPLGFVMIPLLTTYAIGHAVSYIRHGVSRVDTILTGKWIDRLLLLLIFAMFGVWVARFFGAFGGPVPV